MTGISSVEGDMFVSSSTANPTVNRSPLEIGPVAIQLAGFKFNGIGVKRHLANGPL